MKKDIRKKILIVEDEEKLRTTVADFLKLYDYNIIEAKDGEEAVREIEDQMNEIDLVLLDIMLPIYDGQYVDDYIKKPFMLAVLKARVEAVLKRTQREEDDAEELVAGRLRLDCKARKIYVDDDYIITTPKEFDLLRFFIQNQNVTLKREQILDAVWGSDYDGTYRTVDTIIKQIRIKLGEECPYIKSIYGVGYIFEI